MFTKLTRAQRIQLGLVLAIAFLLVFGSNRLDQRHFSTIQKTVNSVYNDRVVVQDYIYRLSNIINSKKLELFKNETPDVSQNKIVEQILGDFGKTELTSDEHNQLNVLHVQYGKLQDLEKRILNPTTKMDSDLGIIVKKTLDEMLQSLDALAEIQLTESAQLTQLSKKSLGMNILLSKLEVAFMIIIGIAMLALVFYPIRTMRPVRD